MMYRQLIFALGLMISGCTSPNDSPIGPTGTLKVDAFQVSATPISATAYLAYHLEGLPGLVRTYVVRIGPLGYTPWSSRTRRPLVQPNVQLSDTFRVQFPDSVAIGSTIPAQYYLQYFFVDGQDTSDLFVVSDSIGVAISQ
jgi:hypothetical protein